MKRVISAMVIAILHVSVAGAAQPLEWSDAWSEPLFEDDGGTWAQQRLGGMLDEARAYADPAGAGEEAAGDDAEMSAECIAMRADPDADIGEMLRTGCQPTLAQMSALMDNPLGNVAMLFNQLDLYELSNDEVNEDRKEYQTNYMILFQFPKKLNENWNLINRVVFNIPSVPLDQDKINAAEEVEFPPFNPPGGGPSQPPPNVPFLPIDRFSGRTSGFGDIYYVGLLSPAEPIRHGPGKISVWGLGLDLSFPSASDDLLGDGAFSTGPSALYAYMGPKWKMGGLIQNYLSYAKFGGRDDVRLMNLQYFVFYSLTDTLSIGAAPNIIANWQAESGDRWTVPIGLGVSNTFQFGKVPVRFGVEFHYNVERPNTVGANWNFRFYVIPAAPSALFKWMQ
jgi:hypothetical protein